MKPSSGTRKAIQLWEPRSACACTNACNRNGRVPVSRSKYGHCGPLRRAQCELLVGCYPTKLMVPSETRSRLRYVCLRTQSDTAG